MITVKTKFLFKKITFEQGKLYYFSYRKFEQDPKPFIVFINFLRGTNRATGSFYNFIQAINLHYLTKPSRIKLVNLMKKINDNKSPFKLIGGIPGVNFAIRRYIMSASYVNRVKEIGDGIVEIKKPEHARMYLPKGVKFTDLMSKRIRPRSLRKKKQTKKQIVKRTKRIRTAKRKK